RDHNSKELGHNSGALYIDRYFDKIAFTVYHDQGIYFRSCSLDKLNVELSRTIDYLEDYVEITNLCIYIGDSKIKADELLEKEEQPESTQDNSKDGPEDYLFDDQSDTRALKLPVIKDNFEQIIRDLELNKSDVSSLNILSQLPVEKKKKRNKYRFIIYFVIFLIIVVNSVSFYMIYKERENSFISYNEQLLQLEPSLNQLENIETQLDINKEQVESYYQILENKQSYLQYIYVLSNTLPEDVKINHLSFESDRMIILDGSAPSASGVMASLEDSEMFNNLEFLGGIVIEGEYERFRIAGDLSDD
ncbi:MAG: PilN domain-containing protein, partial [Halanaerobiales bacterium]